MEMLKTNSPSGCEDEMRDLILNEVKDMEHFVDSMGNVIVHKPGKGKRVLLSAHMDEVGFIVSKITESGAVKFKTVGGILTTVLLGKKVTIGKDRVPGITGFKAVHLQSGGERDNMLSTGDIVIDIGAKDKASAEKKVKVGDYGTFESEAVEYGDNLLKCKGLDDKVGCAALLELLKMDTDLDLYASFTVQEEVGCRGSIIAANFVKPDYAIIFEGTTCSDVFGTPEEKTVTHLGSGCALTAMDGAAVADREMFELAKKVAKENNIPYQVKRTTMGGTDAGSIQRSGMGVKTVVISTPCRYIHSAVCVMNKKDFEAQIALGKAMLRAVSVL
ncbi:MAG: M20/M25/M40 family metallo-hydrolase [Clostridia bacterium]|nr:M20/M25/M40 family metallo-hydrolase [Clostridia bacterium]